MARRAASVGSASRSASSASSSAWTYRPVGPALDAGDFPSGVHSYNAKPPSGGRPSSALQRASSPASSCCQK